MADLRRYYKRHAKSDRIDARVLARLPLVNLEHLHRLRLPTAMSARLSARLQAARPVEYS